VYSLAAQVDGKILVAGDFGTLGGQSRTGLGRLNPDGTVDSGFKPVEISQLDSLALQANGMMVVDGEFGELFRLSNTELATEALSYEASTITWLRGGASPELWYTTFEVSTGNTSWTPLGDGSRISGGWQLGGVSVPTGATIRARGYYGTGLHNDSSSVVETLLYVLGQTGPQIILGDGHFGFGAHGFGFDVSGPAGQAVAVDGSSDLLDWLPLQTNTVGSGPFYFSDPAAKAEPWQFYRARIVP
jgi:hypothetical protein